VPPYSRPGARQKGRKSGFERLREARKFLSFSRFTPGQNWPMHWYTQSSVFPRSQSCCLTRTMSKLLTN